MVLIVGLGNPGSKYQYSRHNVGFMAVDSFLKKVGQVEESVWQENRKLGCWLARVKTKRFGELIIVKPLTYMNDSGKAVSKVLRYYQINPLGLYVVHDEVDLPLGKIRVVVNRGAAGHHGVESIIQAIGTGNFARVRIGIGESRIGALKNFWKKTRATEDYVLRSFQKNEEGKLNEAIKRTVAVLEIALKEGVERAMAKYN